MVEFMFVFGDAARLVWQARQTHKFLVHKFPKWYFCHRTAAVSPVSPADGLDTGETDDTETTVNYLATIVNL